eukprot:UN20753
MVIFKHVNFFISFVGHDLMWNAPKLNTALGKCYFTIFRRSS